MNNGSTPKPLGARLDIAVFVCGSVVMVFEIIGSRVVAPFIGSSTYVWTSLIGVILGALSLGYWYGGRLADKHPRVSLLASIVFASGSLIALTTILKDIVLSAVAVMPVGLELKAVTAALLLFAPASFALGIVTPFAVRLRLSSVGSAGADVGRLYALSTVGSIVGTFAAGFVLLPIVGSLRCLYLIALILFLASILLAPLSLSQKNIGILALFALGVVSNELLRVAAFQSAGLVDVDTSYNRVWIFNAEDPETKRPIRALRFDPFAAQSAMFLDSDDLVFEYSRFYRLAEVLRPNFERSLIIGGAGYSFPKFYLRSYPNARLDVVEIDPGMTQLAREYFRLTDSPRLSIYHEDGRAFLNRAPEAAYDVVFVDAFNTLFSVPFQLTTVEAVRNIDRTLRPDGVVLFNIGSAINGPAANFLHAELKTYQQVFRNVFVFKVKPERKADELQNLIVVACKTACFDNRAAGDAEIDSLLARRYTAPIALDLPELTDDLAPVERYSSIAERYQK